MDSFVSKVSLVLLKKREKREKRKKKDRSFAKTTFGEKRTLLLFLRRFF